MRFNLFLLLFISVLLSCNEEITVGSSLLDGGSVVLDYTDTLAISGKTISSDPVVSFRNSSTFTGRTYLLGQIDDPVFGSSFSELYLNTSIVDQNFPIFDTLTLDSVVMVLPLDTLGQFGVDGAVHNIEVYQLTEQLTVESQDTIYSNQRFETEMTPLASFSRRVSHRDSLEIYSIIEDTLLKVPPQLRIPLDTNFWSAIARDTSINRNDDVYQETVRGFVVRTTSSENSMIGVDLSAASAVALQLYYSTDDTTHTAYFFDLGNIRSNYFEHDFSGTDVDQAIIDSSSNLFYLQEMNGPDIELDISSILDYSNRVINRATIDLVLVDEMDPVVRPVDQLRVSYINDDGNKTVIRDNLLEPATVIQLFNGSLDSLNINGLPARQYSFDITNHVNFIISGDITSTKIFVESSNKSQGAARSVIYGPAHQEFPAKFKLISSIP